MNAPRPYQPPGLRPAGSRPRSSQAVRTRLAGSALPLVGKRTRLDLLGIALGGAILTYVWRVQDLYPILSAVKLPIVVSLLALALYVFNGEPERRLDTIKNHAITKYVVVIVVLAVLSVPTSIYPGYSFAFIRDDLGKNFILMLILAASVRSLADVERNTFVLVVGGMIYSEFVYLYVQVESNGRLGHGLAYYDANDLGMLLVSSIPLALFFLIRGRTIVHRGVALLALGLYGVTIVKSGSRGAFIGLIALALFLLFGFTSVALWKRLVAVAFGWVMLLALGTDKYWTMMRTLLHPQSDYNWAGQADSGRMEVWKRGLGYMFAHPLLGVGASAFPIAEGKLSPLAVRQQLGIGLKWSAAHNSFVQIGAELGVAGLVAFCVLIVVCFRTLRTIRRCAGRTGEPPQDAQVLAQALAGSIVGYAVCGFFLSQAYAAYAFTLYGIIVGLSKVVVPSGQLPSAVGHRKDGRPRLRWAPVGTSGPASPVAANPNRPTIILPAAVPPRS